MILLVEIQREIHVSFIAKTSAMVVRTENLGSYGYGAGKGNIKKKVNAKWMDRHCDNYGIDRHEKDTCFKLHGFPDWYKELKMKKFKPASMAIAIF